MDKNPFSIFDFLGYLFPGCFATLILYFCSRFDIKNFFDLCKIFMNDVSYMSKDTDISWDKIFIFIIFSYVIGHLISYLSSLTVEQYAIWMYGYPSDFLLKELNKKYFHLSDKKNKIRKYLWRGIIGLCLLPISLGTLLFSKLLGGECFFVKPLDKQMKKTIINKCFLFAQYIDYCIESGDTDLNRAIYHYEYEQQPKAAVKMDNYVALYDFLRAVALIFNSLFFYLFIKALFGINISESFDWNTFFSLLMLVVITYLSFMGFMKFYRRYTLESFMCLITDMSYRSPKKKKHANS